MPALLSFPDWGTNPYMSMLNLAPRAVGWDVVGGVRSLDGLEQHAARLAAGDVLHIQWTAPVTGGAQSLDEALTRVARFHDVLSSARDRGVHVLWTVHNVIGHDAAFYDAEILIAKILIANATRIVQLNPDTVAETAEHYALPADKMVTLPHSSYLGVYPDGRDDAASRERTGVPATVPTVGFIGQIRAYKGFDVLCAAVSRAAESIDGLTLVVAGRIAPGEDEEAVRAMLPERHVASFGFVEDADYGDWLRASDVVALPYRRILNSGSLLAAATFDRACVIPGQSPVSRLFADQSWVVRYADPTTGEDEAEALAAGIVEASGDTEERRRAAHAFARTYTPYDMSRDYLRLLESLAADTGAGVRLPAPRRGERDRASAGAPR